MVGVKRAPAAHNIPTMRGWEPQSDAAQLLHSWGTTESLLLPEAPARDWDPVRCVKLV